MKAAKRYDVFFSYKSSDARVVEPFADALRAAGITVFLDRWYLNSGSAWMTVLEETLLSCRAVAVFIGANDLGPWQQKEVQLAMDREARDPDFHVIPILLPSAEPPLGFLRLNTWIDASESRADAIHALTLAARGARPIEGSIDPQTLVSPYRGLRPFREEDAPFFFGRQPFSRKLADTLEKKNFITVVGPSGSGKSSVVRAGLVPRVRKNLGGQVWEVAVMTPGERPFEALAENLLPLYLPDADAHARLMKIGELADSLKAGKISLRLVLQEVLRQQPGTDRLLLVVDQWEEFFTLAEAKERDSFASMVIDALDQAPLSIVATVRGDFLDDMLENRKLSDRLTVEHIGGLNDDELREIIEKPAEAIGAGLEPGLAERIIVDLRASSEGLSLLEFVLAQLWIRRHEGVLTHSAYAAIGHLAGAIATHADKELEKLTKGEQDLARKVFLRLVRPGRGTEATKRPCAFAHLPDGSESVVKKLADARLVVTGVKAGSDEKMAELAHEALIRQWGRLGAWMAEEEKFLVWRERLRTDIERWDEAEHNRDFLLRGRMLREAKAWRRSHNDQLNEDEREFVRRSGRPKPIVVASYTIILVVVLGGAWIGRNVYEFLTGPSPFARTGSTTDVTTSTETLWPPAAASQATDTLATAVATVPTPGAASQSPRTLALAPALISPPDNAVFELKPDLKVELRWDASSTGQYQLQVSRSRLFATLEITSRRQTQSASTVVSSEGSFYWRVASVGADGEAGPFSPFRRFRVVKRANTSRP